MYRAGGAGEAAGPEMVAEGEASGIGTDDAKMRFQGASGEDLSRGVTLPGGATAEQAAGAVADAVSRPGDERVDAVGYRVVHPGAKLTTHVRVTPEVLDDLRAAAAFAPLHDPEAVRLIEEMERRLPQAGHFACFDTVFHETMPEQAKRYALGEEMRAQGVRRYGFHGLSCESVVRQMRDAGVLPRRLVMAHLGSGCSVTAIVDGRSIENTMGLTPTGGVVMGTRPGDLDPGVVLYLLRQQTGDLDAAVKTVEKMLNHDAGVHAVSGMGNDMKHVREAAEAGDERARLAIEVFTRSVRKAIGSYVALMGGVDGVAFAGGIGENDARSRKEVLVGLGAMGIELEDSRNLAKGSGMREISPEKAATRVWVAPADEDRAIARHVVEMTGL